MTDFSTPRRMSAVSLIILFLKSLREFIGITVVAIGTFLMDLEDSRVANVANIILVVGIMLGVSLAAAFVKYYFRKFHIEGDKLIFTHGFAAKNTTSIPLSSVHTLRTKRGVLYRALDLRGVTFDTLAGAGREVELILDEAEWQALLSRVRVGEDSVRTADTAAAPRSQSSDSTLHVSDTNILKGALCQNHLKGFAILATAVLTVLDKVSQFDEDDTYRVLGYIESHAGAESPSIWEWVLLFAAIYLVVVLLWIGKIVLRYSGMSIRMADGRLTVESGLLSRYTCRISRDKATVFTIKQNPLERMAGCQTITVRQAQNVTGTEKEGNIRIYGSDLGAQLYDWWLGGNHSAADTPLLSAKSGKGMFVRLFLPHFILALAAALILIYVARIEAPAVAVCAIYAAIMVLRAVMAWKHSGIALYDRYILINCGYIATIREYVRYRDVESVSIRMNPLTYSTGRVALKICTNARNFTVPSLTIGDAIALRSHILRHLSV